MNYPKISIVTPNYNQATFLEQTILSVLNQGYPNLEYIIIDGGSTDGSLEIIHKYESQLAYWISEPDGGMYEAIQKGFAKSSGEIMGWINSDDILHTNSLEKLAQLFTNNPTVNWIQGYPTVIDKNGDIVFSRAPRYTKDAFLLKKYHDWKFIQQESTYWRRNLWVKAGSRISTEYLVAGDFELWMRFFKHAKLYITNDFIGAFRLREEQLSAVNGTKYLIECDNIINKHIKSLGILEQIKLRILKKLEPFISNKYAFIRNRIYAYRETDSDLIL